MKKSILYMIKKIIIGVGIILVLGFINSCEVNAATYQSQSLNIDTVLLPNSTTETVNLNLFNNFGKGYVIFTYSYSPLYGNYEIFRVVNEIKFTTNNGNQFICDIGGAPTTWNNQNQYIYGSAVCKIDVTGTYLKSIIFGGDHQTGYQGIKIITSSIITFIQDDEGQDIDRIINSIVSLAQTNAQYTEAQTNSLINALQQQNQQTISQQIITNQNITKTNEELKDLNDLLKDNSTPASSDVNNVISGATTNNATVSDLVNLIPNTLQVIVNGLNRGCTGGYNLGALFGTDLVLPCINPVDYLGSFLWGVIDSILCLCYLIPFSKWIVNTYNDLTSLKNRRLM